MSEGRYTPQAIESRWYRTWLEHNLFAPDPDSTGKPFCIVIPPPNVTGSLHMGHAWDNTLQDILIRWKRMQGRKTLWVPGTDHAGIATQWMVEKTLRAKGQSKEDIGREAFLELTWAFKEESHGTIVGQLQRLGVSCDWTRERFTMDDGLSRAVRKEFVTLYNEGLIYRDLRMINWSPGLISAISDLEVDHKEVQSHLWHLRYPLSDGSGHLIVATTRPETMLADSAVAVHPEDERYRALVGKTVRLPLAERDIPIIADSYVDPAFGTGALKVTPGHDFNDFEIGKRHNLPILTVMSEDGHLVDVPEAYAGLDVPEARKRVVADLQARDLVEKIEPHTHAVGFCSRSGARVEPRVSRQWFVAIKSLAEPALEAVRSKRIRLLPEYQEKIYYEWMENIQDWCISRQLWWGHRIPVWYCGACNEVIVSEEDVTACTHCGSGQLTMETDVLDTWFSSGLWPFSTLGWPEDTEDLRTFYPTDVLVTGYDILFFWVARMAMLGLKFMGEVPFHEVLLHGLLRDAQGEKMSKTKGNGLDPLEMIDKYGADALRFTLAAGTVPGRDIILQESGIEGHRNFINKIWNATRFALQHAERLGGTPAQAPAPKLLFNRWMLGRLNEVCAEVDGYLEQRRFNEACRVLYGFVWHEYCDWYVEIVKPVLQGGSEGANGDGAADADAQETLATLLHGLGAVLRLLHPVMPYVTEELWQRLPGREGFLMVQPFPQAADFALDAQALRDGARLIELIGLIRTVRGENGLKPKQRIEAVVKSDDAGLPALLEAQHAVVSTLAGLSELRVEPAFVKQGGWAHGVGTGFEVFLSLAGQIDVASERERIGREMERTQARMAQLSGKLNNPAFVDKAPAHVVEKNREELAALEAQVAKLSDSLAHLGSL